MSHKNLEIWQMAREIAIAIHKVTLTKLPKCETERNHGQHTHH